MSSRFATSPRVIKPLTEAQVQSPALWVGIFTFAAPAGRSGLDARLDRSGADAADGTGARTRAAPRDPVATTTDGTVGRNEPRASAELSYYMNAESKVTAEHLQRGAYLYIRQSTLRQVLENTESRQRQYALRRRAIALGWPEERIIVIDHDQGQSGASTVDREGFQRLVTEVGLGKAGIVTRLEVSRLARNCADWHRLLEICALTHTLILDKCEAIKNVE